MRKNFGVKPWFYPLPVLIIGTYDETGKADAMNAAWGGLYDANKIELLPLVLECKFVRTTIVDLKYARFKMDQRNKDKLDPMSRTQ